MKYRCILADPPWAKRDDGATAAPKRFKPGERTTSVNRGWEHKRKIAIGTHYEVMSEAAITALPVSDLAAESAHLWLWSLNSTMEQAYRVVRAWGFIPMGVVTWKKNSYGMGFYFRLNTEQLLFAVRGKRELPEVPWMGSCIESGRGRHSEKPGISYDLIEQVSPAPRLELFARSRRLGWDSWGDEVDSDLEIAT